MANDDIRLRGRAILHNLPGMAIQNQRKDALRCNDRIHGQAAIIDFTLPLRSEANQLDTVRFISDSDFIDHWLRSASVRAVRFHPSFWTVWDAGRELPPPLLCPFPLAAKSAAESAAISEKLAPLPEVLGAFSSRSRKPVSTLPATKSGW